MRRQHNADYIRLWHGDAQVLMASLEIVQRTSAQILVALSLAEKRPADDAGDQKSDRGSLCANVSGG